MRKRFDAGRVRCDVYGWIMTGYAMEDDWSKLAALRAMAQITDDRLQALWKDAGSKAQDPRSGYTTHLPLGPAENAKAWNVARFLGLNMKGKVALT